MLKVLISKAGQIRKVANLSSSLKDKIFLIWWSLWMALRHRLGIRQEKAGKLKLSYKGKDFSFYSSYSTDLSVIDEVFIKEVYALPENINPKVILDLGSNTGVTVKFFEVAFPNARIFAFEPSPEVFKSLKRNFESSPLVKTMNIAVTGKDREVEFYIHPKSPIVSSIMPRFDEQHKISVPGKSLNTLIQELGVDEIDLIKFDVEGAEKEIFSSFDTSRIKVAVGELHTDLAGLSPEGFKTLFPTHRVDIKEISPTRYAIFAERGINA